METTSQYALSRLSEFSTKDTLQPDEQAELLALMASVSPGEVQRLRGQWRRSGLVLALFIAACLPIFGFFLYVALVLYLRVSFFVVFLLTSPIGVRPQEVYLVLHGIGLAALLYRRRADLLRWLRALWQWPGRQLDELRFSTYRDRELLKLWRAQRTPE